MCEEAELNPLKYDVIVVGAGPAGLLSAGTIARKGYDVAVFEEHASIGRPVHCAGLLSSSGLAGLGLNPPEHVVQNQVEGARIYSPACDNIEIRRGRREAIVVDRGAFDRWLAESAESEGARIMTDSKIESVSITETRVEVHLQRSHSPTRGEVLVNAEGSRCQISQDIGLPAVPRSSKLAAYQYEMSNVDIDEKQVEMFYGRHLAPGFFAWIIPLGNNRARVGLASRNQTMTRLKRGMKHHPVLSRRLQNASVDRGLGGVVLVGRPIERTYDTRAVVVGDAAGHVKATTGGGVILGGQAAELAGETVVDALEREDLSADSLAQYETRWRRELGSEFLMMWLAQKALTSLSDKGLNRLISGARDLQLQDVIGREGDMDRQAKVIRALIQDPRMFLLGLDVIRFLSPLF
ncbi:NAD(P)/FAD-dependent oxidoreductase [Candidatus Thorarchaeota archaeon]|nr:MAG: NAD(P)/FAD-dependent oxidoreductase [Candidatus Thorarchaeota archaeon]